MGTRKISRQLRRLSRRREPEPEEVDLVVRYRPESLEALTKLTKFSRREIQLMYRGFKQNCTTGIVTLEQFKEIYAQFFPQDCGRYANFVFNTFDTDHSGTISFEEFVTGISVLSRGTMEDKINWIFQLYDIKGVGFITKDDMRVILESVYDLMGHYVDPPVDDEVIDEHVDDVFQQMDYNSDGMITQSEFLQACIENEKICSSLDLFKTIF